MATAQNRMTRTKTIALLGLMLAMTICIGSEAQAQIRIIPQSKIDIIKKPATVAVRAMEFDGGNDKYLNFEIEQFKTYLLKEDGTVRFHGYYDIEKNSFVKGKTKNVQTEKENFKIGEYEFYSDRVKYGPLMGHYYCYYLHRITNGKDEILLYHFDESNGRSVNPVLFDDIYTK